MSPLPPPPASIILLGKIERLFLNVTESQLLDKAGRIFYCREPEAPRLGTAKQYLEPRELQVAPPPGWTVSLR